MFLAQLVGGLVGCVMGPYAFMLFYKTGQVRVAVEAFPGWWTACAGPQPDPVAYR
jgi:hypothetical protein